jgi:flavin-dependent thymidylate synthase
MLNIILGKRFYNTNNWRISNDNKPNFLDKNRGKIGEHYIDNLEALKYNVRKIHDNGYVQLIDLCPRITPLGILPESAIARSARVSTSMGERTLKEDSKLIYRLVKDHHTSPLETLSFIFNIRTPIEVMRQLVRHRTFRINEFSLRYKQLLSEHDNTNFCPVWNKKYQFMYRTKTTNGVRLQGTNDNKQGTTTIDNHNLRNQLHKMLNLDQLYYLSFIDYFIENCDMNFLLNYHHNNPHYIYDNSEFLIGRFNQYTSDFICSRKIEAKTLKTIFQDTEMNDSMVKQYINQKVIKKIISLQENLSETQFKLYHQLCSLGAGREIARSYLPLATYTEINISCDMNNLLKFFYLRSDRKHAQTEIADVSDAMKWLITPFIPTIIGHYNETTAK